MLFRPSLVVVLLSLIAVMARAFSPPRPVARIITSRSQVSMSFISADDRYSLWAATAISAALGLRLEKGTTIGKALSGPVCSMLISATMTNIGVLPQDGSVYMTALQGFVVKLATPLLLLGADLSKIARVSKNMLFAFVFGSLGTLTGTWLGFLLFGPSLNTIGSLGDGWKVASALAAKNIGGGLNFLAVCDALSVSQASIGLALAVDNVLGLLYFPLISYISRDYLEVSESEDESSRSHQQPLPTIGNDDTDVLAATSALAIALSIVAVGEGISKSTNLPAVPVATGLTVLLATLFPLQLAPFVPKADFVGKILLLLFFGSIGNTSGTIASLVSTKGAASLLGFGTVLYIVHLVVIFTLGNICRIAIPDICVASNANIGNAATAASLCASKGWKGRVLPAILVGTLGNSIATFLGLGFGSLVLRGMK